MDMRRRAIAVRGMLDPYGRKPERVRWREIALVVLEHGAFLRRHSGARDDRRIARSRRLGLEADAAQVADLVKRFRDAKLGQDARRVTPAVIRKHKAAPRKPGERTGKFRLGTENPVFNDKGESTIAAADLAVAVLDEIEKPQHKRKRFTVGY